MTARASRRELLLTAAADLFAAKGYHAVGIDDIGAAAGISGPGVYRHFAGKEALLAALCDRALTRLLDAAREATQSPDPASALQSLVDLHVAFAVEHRALLAVWTREQRELSDDVRRAIRRRQRAYEQPWRQVVEQLRDDLTRDEAALAVRATLAMVNATALVDVDVPAEKARRLLRRMALAALLVRRTPTRR